MLPPLKPDSPRLADVLRSCLGAVAASDNALGFSAVQKAIVVVIDGLGHMQLKAHSGHARFLAPASKPLVSGFPTTTASALASLATGASAGTHGIVGYDAFVPGVGVRNQLRDWGADMDPVAHQRSQPLWRDGCAVVSEAKHRSSGFTAAILRGAEYIGHDRLSNRVEAASEAARTHDVTYLYLPELDRLGHSGGVASDAWVSKLEEIDGLLADLAAANPDAGIAVTADHGMV
ncbi:alkaline phosphatase family protein, partial [Agrococcus casei]